MRVIEKIINNRGKDKVLKATDFFVNESTPRFKETIILFRIYSF
jgi:hypothetical protein